MERGEEDIFLSGYAKHLVKETSPAVAAEVWKVPYGIIKDKKTINKNLKNNFANI